MTTPHSSAAAIEVHLTLEEMAFGCEREVDFDAPGDCVNCEGSGRDDGQVCMYCDGTGTMVVTRSATVDLPAGLGEGEVVHVDPGGSDPGLVLLVHQRRHPVFERDGLDLRTTVSVEPFLLERGGAVDVETLDGEVLVDIEPGEEAGAVLRVEGQGMPSRERPEQRGDLLVRIDAETPATPEQREVRRSGTKAIIGGLALMLVGAAVIVGALVWRSGQTVCEPSATVLCLRDGVEVTAEEQEGELNAFAIGWTIPGIVVAGVGAFIVTRGFRTQWEAEPPIQSGSD
ncbi:DnaJ C-terminal domain-containing protein [Glycomyces tarimensis]